MKSYKEYFGSKLKFIFTLGITFVKVQNTLSLEELSTVSSVIKPKIFKVDFGSGATVNIHSPKKALPSTYLLAICSPVFFFQDKKTPGSVYSPVDKYCLGKYLLPFSYSVSIIGHNSHRSTPKPSLRQI